MNKSKSCQIVRRDDIDWVLPSSVMFVKAAEVLKGQGLPKVCVHVKVTSPRHHRHRLTKVH